LEEVEVRADLDRLIARVADRQPHGSAAGVDLDRLVREQPLARDHGNGFETETSRLPVRKGASTLNRTTNPGTPSLTAFPASTCLPSSIVSATERPSRAASRSASAIRAIDSGKFSFNPRSRRRRASSATW